MDARCPECENVAQVNDEQTKVTCPHCKFEASYDEYLEIMKDQALNMAADYIPDRPGRDCLVVLEQCGHNIYASRIHTVDTTRDPPVGPHERQRSICHT